LLAIAVHQTHIATALVNTLFMAVVGCRGNLFRFQIDRRLGAQPQTELQNSKAKQQHIVLIWTWIWN
jgi:hypothetical protein